MTINRRGCREKEDEILGNRFEEKELKEVPKASSERGRKRPFCVPHTPRDIWPVTRVGVSKGGKHQKRLPLLFILLFEI